MDDVSSLSWTNPECIRNWKVINISHHTVKKYLDILSGTFMVRLLTPWFENISKRQVKSPKIYIRDSGLLHALLGIQDEEQLQLYPKLGSDWEGFAVEEIIKEYHASFEECYFWSTQTGAELDLLIIKDGKRLGFEFKNAPDFYHNTGFLMDS